MAVMIACGCGCHLPREKGEMLLGTPCEFCRDAHDLNPSDPDILSTPDPDKEPPMTTIPIPGTALDIRDIPVITTDEAVIAARTPDQVATLITKANASPVVKPYVQKAKGGEGVGALGLYLEAVVHTAAGEPFTHMKFFVVDKTVVGYSRTKGDARANWRRRDAASLHAALLIVQTAIDKPGVRVFGHPILVELTAADLSTLEEGGMPQARFRGQYRIEKDFGRYDFEMPIVTAEIPAAVQRVLQDGFVTAK